MPYDELALSSICVTVYAKAIFTSFEAVEFDALSNVSALFNGYKEQRGI